MYKNDRKITYINKVDAGSYKYLIKGHDINSPKAVKEGFDNEKLIYGRASRYMPQLLNSDDHTISIEYIDGQTLGNMIFTGGLKGELINNIFSSAIDFYKDIKINTNNKSFSNFKRYISVLKSSGPIQNKDLKIESNWFFDKAHYLSLFFLKLICTTCVLSETKLFNVNYYPGFSHSDFHYNNIIIKSETPFFIDFERSSLSGYFYFDMIFLLVILESVYKEDHRKLLSKDNKNILLGSPGKIIIYLSFKWAVFKNKKFNKKLK